jgi:hypothetical protein
MVRPCPTQSSTKFKARGVKVTETQRPLQFTAFRSLAHVGVSGAGAQGLTRLQATNRRMNHDDGMPGCNVLVPLPVGRASRSVVPLQSTRTAGPPLVHTRPLL